MEIDKTIINKTLCAPIKNSYLWKISNFSFSPLNIKKPVYSDLFQFEDSTFIMEANFVTGPYLDGDAELVESDPEDEYLPRTLVVCIRFQKFYETNLVGRISLMNANKQKKYTSELHVILDQKAFENGYAIVEVITEDELLNQKNSFLKDDCLSILCELGDTGVKQNVSKGRDSVTRSRTDCLSRDLGSLFKRKANSDVDVIVEGSRFPVHSLILSARSPVFCAMLQHDMEERNKSTIKITDFSAAAVKRFLNYLYTGEVCDIKKLSPEMLFELYTVADKYNTLELAEMSAKVLVNKMSEHNIEHCARLVSQHNDKKIRDAVIKFFIQNKKMLHSELWKKVVKIIPSLPEQVLSKVI